MSRARSVTLEAANDVRRLYSEGELINRELYGPRRVYHSLDTLARMFKISQQTCFNIVHYKGVYAQDKQTKEVEHDTTN